MRWHNALASRCSDLGKDAATRATSPLGASGSVETRIDTLTAELERSLKEVRRTSTVHLLRQF